MAVTIGADVELGCERFRMSQEASNRVKATEICESSSEGKLTCSGSSDGVDEEVQIGIHGQTIGAHRLRSSFFASGRGVIQVKLILLDLTNLGWSRPQSHFRSKSYLHVHMDLNRDMMCVE